MNRVKPNIEHRTLNFEQQLGRARCWLQNESTTDEHRWTRIKVKESVFIRVHPWLKNPDMKHEEGVKTEPRMTRMGTDMKKRNPWNP